MLALPQEYVGSLCEVKSMSNDLLAMTRIIKIDHDALEFSSDDNNRIPLLQYNTPVKLFVHHAKLDIRILVGVIYLSTENFVRTEEVKPLQDYERRGAFRVNANVTARIFALNDAGEQAQLAAEHASCSLETGRVEFDVRVVDVSLTGIRLQSAVPLPLGMQYGIKFAILDTPMNFCIKIQRHIEMPNGDIQYGCLFLDYSQRQMDVLCKELFQLQRFEKNRRRNAASMA